MLNVSKIARASEWWEYKLPPMLSIVYAICLVEEKNIFEVTPKICLLLLGIIIGAAYVSIINDLTDLKEDEACGKKNRLSALSPFSKGILVSLPIIAGIFFTYFFLSDLLSVILYVACWISFSLYSIPPFRFKKRGFLGVLADASGAHLLPCLFLVSATYNYLHLQIDWFFFGLAAVWSFMFGLRGILWHQFYDKDNDAAIGLSTYATKKNPAEFSRQSLFIICIELVSLIIILAYIFHPLPVVALLVYIIMLAGYYKIFKRPIIAIVSPNNAQWHFAMSNYYQFLLPLALLCSNAILWPQVWILVVVHFLLFPVIARNTITDAIIFIKAVAKRLRYS